MLTRRRFSVDAMRALLGYALVDTIVGNLGCAPAGSSGGRGMDPDAEAMVGWLRNVNELGQQVKAHTIDEAAWQNQMEELLSGVDLEALAGYLDLDQLVGGLALPASGAAQKAVVLPDDDGLPAELVFVRQVFAMREGCAIIPHGHHNMVSTFLIMGGSFRGRHYERLEVESDALIITPTIDETFVRGDVSSITDLKDNVHWYVAQEERSYLLNLHVRDVIGDGTTTTGRIYVDPNGEKLDAYRTRAPILTHDEGLALYGSG